MERPAWVYGTRKAQSGYRKTTERTRKGSLRVCYWVVYPEAGSCVWRTVGHEYSDDMAFHLTVILVPTFGEDPDENSLQ